MVTPCDTTYTFIDRSVTDHLTLNLNNHHLVDDSNTCFYDLIDVACRQINQCWIGAIKMCCVVDDTYSTSSDALSRAGKHQKYATKLLSSISFCRFTYPTQDGFTGPGFLQLGDDLILAAAKTGYFHLIRNGSRKMKLPTSHCYRFMCARCLLYQGGLSSRQDSVYR